LLRAVSIKPSNIQSYDVLAKLYSNKRDNTKSIIYYEKILEYKPRDTRALNGIAKAYSFLRKFEQSVFILRAILKNKSSQYIHTRWLIANL